MMFADAETGRHCVETGRDMDTVPEPAETRYRHRAPTVAEAIKILSWPNNTREYRRACLDLWREMGGDALADEIELKFREVWRKRGKQ